MTRSLAELPCLCWHGCTANLSDRLKQGHHAHAVDSAASGTGTARLGIEDAARDEFIGAAGGVVGFRLEAAGISVS